MSYRKSQGKRKRWNWGQNYIRVLAELVHPPAGSETILMAYKINLDETGIEQGAPIVVVAGLGTTTLRLGMLQTSWMKAIRRAGLKEFKSKQFFDHFKAHRWDGSYAGWTDQKAITLLYKLLRLIRNLSAFTVGTAMVVGDFISLEDRARRYLTGAKYNPWKDKLKDSGAPKTPFHVPMQNTMIIAAHHAPRRDLAHFVCDRQDQYAGYVVTRFNEIRNRFPQLRMGDLVHSDSQKVAALQAADLICTVVQQQAWLRLTRGRIEPTDLMAWLTGPQFRFDYFDKSILKVLAEGMQPRKSSLRI